MSESEEMKNPSIRFKSRNVFIRKQFRDSNGNIPTLRYQFRSAMDETVSIEMVDTLPDGIDIEGVGFNPKWGGDSWEKTWDGEHGDDEQSLRFTIELEPGETVKTVFGIRDIPESVDSVGLLREPIFSFDGEVVENEIDPDVTNAEGVSPEEAGGDLSMLDEGEGDRGESVADALGMGNDDSSASASSGGVADALGIGDDDDDSGGEEDDETGVASVLNADSDDEEDEEEEDSEEATEDESEAEDESEDSDADEGDAPQPTGSIAEQLVTELQSGEVPADTRTQLAEELEDELDIEPEQKTEPASVKLDHLRDKVADLEAYTGALEEFIAEEGTAEELIERTDEQLDEFESEIDDVEARIRVTQSDLSDNVERLEDDLEESVEGIEDDLSELESTVESELDDRAEEVNERLSDIETRLDDLEHLPERVEKIEQFREGMSSVLGDE